MTAVDSSGLFGALVDSNAWPPLRLALHVAFFLSVFYLIKLVFGFKVVTDPQRVSRRKDTYRIPMMAVAILFACVLVYQGTWQLTGVFRPEFVAFMQSHDRRQFNPAHWIRRGRILDHRGEVLAFSQEHQGQVYRLYPYGPAFAHAVGYSHPKYGATGMEAAANVHLNGGVADSLPAWGELGRQLLTRSKSPRGQDLVLTLDAELQVLAVKSLGDRRGAVVMLRPGNGAIRVLASTPAFDPNRVTPLLFQGEDPGAPLLNRATQGLYPPGSTFKIVISAMALEGGFEGTLYCPPDGYTTSAHYRKIRDHEYYEARREGRIWKGHGNLDLATALAESSNVFFAQLGVRQGHDAFRRAVERLYFNRQISLYQSPYGSWAMSTGRIPEIAPSDLYGLAQASVGQGNILATPSHMALITAAVANQGVAVKPRLVESDGSESLDRFMTEATAVRLAKMLRRAVADGTGRGIDLPGLAIAGKTGTAENPQGPPHSWFVGFAPAERPAMAVAVLVEHGGYGSAAAAPIARDLLVRANELGLLR